MSTTAVELRQEEPPDFRPHDRRHELARVLHGKRGRQTRTSQVARRAREVIERTYPPTALVSDPIGGSDGARASARNKPLQEISWTSWTACARSSPPALR